jgi:hypothetical protein
MTERNRSNASIPAADELARRDRARAEGAEQEVANQTPVDPRDQTDAYLRKLERTEHWKPIREAAGSEQ